MRFDALSEEMASGEVRRLFAEIRRELGLMKVPRFFRVMGRNPPLLRAMWTLYQSLILDGLLPRTTKELLALAVESGPDGSEYFREFHRSSLLATGMNRDLVDAVALEGDSPLLPERTRKLIAFARRVAWSSNGQSPEEVREHRDPLRLTAAETASFRREGLDSAAVSEIVALTGGICTINACARVFGLQPDFDSGQAPQPPH